MLTRLWVAGVDTFSILKIAGRNSTIGSERYMHPPPESPEHAFERLGSLNANEGRQGDVTFEAATVSTTIGILPTTDPPVVIS